MELWGYLGVLFMGIVLGLIGGGGSILTLPILVYLFGIEPVTATGYSLFIVGLTSIVGAISHIKQGNVHWKTALYFGLPSILSVYLTRLFLVPILPSTIGYFGDFELTKPIFLLLLFTLFMFIAAFTMIRECKSCNEAQQNNLAYNFTLIAFEGLLVGGATGLVGAGGGFLIIPALVLLSKLPMKLAIGTSLVIVAAKSCIGFIGDFQVNSHINWSLLFYITSFAILGIILGTRVSKIIPNEKLKPAFGIFVLIMAVFILTKELFF